MSGKRKKSGTFISWEKQGKFGWFDDFSYTCIYIEKRSKPEKKKVSMFIILVMKERFLLSSIGIRYLSRFMVHVYMSSGYSISEKMYLNFLANWPGKSDLGSGKFQGKSRNLFDIFWRESCFVKTFCMSSTINIQGVLVPCCNNKTIVASCPVELCRYLIFYLQKSYKSTKIYFSFPKNQKHPLMEDGGHHCIVLTEASPHGRWRTSLYSINRSIPSWKMADITYSIIRSIPTWKMADMTYSINRSVHNGRGWTWLIVLTETSPHGIWWTWLHSINYSNIALNCEKSNIVLVGVGCYTILLFISTL